VIRLALPPAELRALLAGETVVAFAGKSPPEGPIELVEGAPLPRDVLRAAYRRWNGEPVPTLHNRARVVADHDVADLDEHAAASRHLRVRLPDRGRMLVLRVEIDGSPVLSDEAFAARHASLNAALR